MSRSPHAVPGRYSLSNILPMEGWVQGKDFKTLAARSWRFVRPVILICRP